MNVLDFFREISAVPRGSYHNEKISSYLVSFARDRKLDYRQDKYGNVVIYKKAALGRESSPAVILQSHMDMVCLKDPGFEHDFENSPLELIEDDDNISAFHTTLGADDGIGMAYALAVLDSEDISHPAIEALFTVDEEVGMVGAGLIDRSWLSGRYMINIDSESEKVLTVGCAGGRDIIVDFPFGTSEQRGFCYDIKLTGLAGGHSGEDINKNRANSVKLISGLLLPLIEDDLIGIIDISAGSKRNAIPSEAECKILVFGADEEKAVRFLTDRAGEIEESLSGTDDNVRISIVKKQTEEAKYKCISKDSSVSALDFIGKVPDGVQKSDERFAGVTLVSSNIGILSLAGENIKIEIMARSSVNEEKDVLCGRIISLAESLGGKTIQDGDYPAWEFRESSALLKLMEGLYVDAFGCEPRIEVIHGGLETSVFFGYVSGYGYRFHRSGYLRHPYSE